MKVGNLHAERDFIDVRDAVRAFHWGVRNGQPGEIYNVCSGQAIRIQNILEILLSMSSHSIMWESQEPYFDYTNRQDIKTIYGSYQKLYQASNWKPTIPLEESLSDLLDYLRLAQKK